MRKLAPDLVLKYYIFRNFQAFSRGHVHHGDIHPLAAVPIMKKAKAQKVYCQQTHA